MMEIGEYIDIVAQEIEPADEEIVKDILRWYLDRTRSHIRGVQEFGRKALQFVKDDRVLTDRLEILIENHDSDKLEDDEFIAHYAPYIVKRYCNDGLQDRFELKDDYKKKWDEEYVVQHCLKNGHHPECWDSSYGYGENHPPYDATRMPEEYLAEMVCDWCAVGLEQGNSAMDWFNKVSRERFVFTEFQKNFIRHLIEAIE